MYFFLCGYKSSSFSVVVFRMKRVSVWSILILKSYTSTPPAFSFDSATTFFSSNFSKRKSHSITQPETYTVRSYNRGEKMMNDFVRKMHPSKKLKEKATLCMRLFPFHVNLLTVYFHSFYVLCVHK